jgi:hypothetical protein
LINRRAAAAAPDTFSVQYRIDACVRGPEVSILHTPEDVRFDGLAGASDQYNGRYAVLVVSEVAGAHTQHSLNEHTVCVARAK